MVNLIVDLDEPRLGADALNKESGALEARGIRLMRESRAPDWLLAWIDLEFGGVWSSEAASGGVCWAEDRSGTLGFCVFDARRPDFYWLRSWRKKPEVGIFGPLGVVERARGARLGAALLRVALSVLSERGYRQALIPVVDEGLTPYYVREAGASVVEQVDLKRGGRRWRATVLASGNGTNFQSAVDGARTGRLPLEIIALIVNRPQAHARQRARAAGIPEILVARDGQPREAYDARVEASVAATEPDLVLLLGWLHILPESFVRRFPQTLNLHPAFLPLDPAADRIVLPDRSVQPVYRGLRAVDDALADGAKWIGASVHRVGVDVDRGTLLARAPLRIVPGESRALLDERLHALEHRVLATAIRRWSWEQ